MAKNCKSVLVGGLRSPTSVIAIGLVAVGRFDLFKTKFSTNLERLGWAEYFKGKSVSTGLFIWTAEIDILDGKRIQTQGNLMVFR